MIPYDSFLIDPPWLLLNGLLIGRFVRSRALRAVAGGATVAVFVVTSVSLYFDARWTDWIVRLCRARSGRDWMLNSGVFQFEFENVGWRTHAVSAALFLTYPLWLVLGVRIGLALRRRDESRDDTEPGERAGGSPGPASVPRTVTTSG